jgi:hypothetical protein
MSDARKQRSRLRTVLDFLWRLLGKQPPQSPADPYAYVTAPLAGGPRSRSGAAAVAEPEEDSYRAYPPRERS